MRATLDTVTRIYATGEHAAFTDLCAWRGRYYVAFRRAYSHGIVPPGQITMPGPVDPGRLLAAELEPGVLATFKGLIAPLRP
mgnify:CR=1 FL=1